MGCLADAGEAAGSRCLQARCPQAEPPGLRRGSACPAPAPPGPCAAGGAGCGQDAFRKCGRGVLLALGEPTVCEKKPMASTTPPDNGAERRGRQGAGPGKAPRAGCVGQRQGGRAERAPRGGRSEHACARRGPGTRVALSSGGRRLPRPGCSWPRPCEAPFGEGAGKVSEARLAQASVVILRA